eukprot:3317955-Rhodomonas_salina.1
MLSTLSLCESGTQVATAVDVATRLGVLLRPRMTTPSSAITANCQDTIKQAAGAKKKVRKAPSFAEFVARPGTTGVFTIKAVTSGYDSERAAARNTTCPLHMRTRSHSPRDRKQPHTTS